MNKIKLISIVTGLSVLLMGCGPSPDMVMQKQSPASMAPVSPVQNNPRLTVTRVGVFEDDLAYSSRRGLYIIVDNKTGKEYIGVSGVGISETGSHSNGKTTSSDER
jgi:hypothetical protein